jgi:ribose-phosphate pyrophosphokinase
VESLSINPNKVKIFSGMRSKDLTYKICNEFSTKLSNSKTEIFPDGEIIVKINEDVRGRDCFVVISTCFPTNDNLMELMIFIDCLRRASAKQIIPVIPYFGYARQDRKDNGRVPITAKLVANLLTQAGANRIIALDLHSAQIQGFFDIPVDHLSATPVFLKYFEDTRDNLGDLCLLSPDVGNVKVAESMANLLGGDLAIINKKRINGSKTISGSKIIGDVKGKTVLLFDDMISTGGTICQAAEHALSEGATRVIAAATHGLFPGPAINKLIDSPIEKIVTTNSVNHITSPTAYCEKFVELCVGRLLSEAIYRVHNNLSLSEMFKNNAGVKR